MLALALLPAGCVSLVTRAYYALDDFRTPVVVSSVLLVANIGLNLVFVRGLGMDVEGLALATAVTSWGNLALLLPVLLRRLPESDVDGEASSSLARLGPMVGASLAAGLAAWGAWSLVLGLAAAPDGGGPGAVLALAAAAVAGIGAYLLLAALLGIPEWRALAARFAARRP